MPNEMRDRLIELIVNADTYDSYECKLCTKEDTSCICCGAEKLADHILANGVIVPPCKVGGTVWSFLEDNRLFECEVKQFYIDKKEIGMAYEPKAFRGRMYGVNIRAIGKTIFLTKEEAEAKLKESESK